MRQNALVVCSIGREKGKKRGIRRRTRPRECVSIDCGLCRAAFLMERV